MVALRRADDGLRGIGLDRLQLGQDAAQVVGAVFAVDQQPVETGAGANFRSEGLAQPKPQAEQHLIGPEGLLEAVQRNIHGAAFFHRFASLEPS